MKVIVAGGRDFNDYKFLENNLDQIFQDDTRFEFDVPVIVCGEAYGADKLGKQYAYNHNLSVDSYPAQWDKLGKSAGYRRNEVMAKVADMCIAFWNGESKGTKHMIETMQKLNKPVIIIRY